MRTSHSLYDLFDKYADGKEQSKKRFGFQVLDLASVHGVLDTSFSPWLVYRYSFIRCFNTISYTFDSGYGFIQWDGRDWIHTADRKAPGIHSLGLYGSTLGQDITDELTMIKHPTVQLRGEIDDW